MRQLNIPKFFHELFGSKQYLSELIIVISFTLIATLGVAWIDAEFWLSLSLLKRLLFALLYLDITGGVIANLTHGTNEHYNKHAKGRWIFLAIHIQPLLLAWLSNSSFFYAILIWIYTMLCACAINLLRHKQDHRTLAGFFMALGLIGLFMISDSLAKSLLIIYALYMIKVIYSFAVNHSLEVKEDGL